MSTKPDLKNYLNVHHYLEDFYKYRKTTEAGFSYETWAQELGITHRSFLRQIVIGRRALTESMAQTFVQRMNLQAQEREYFEALVEYSNCKNQKQRNYHSQKLMALLKKEFRQTEVDNYHELVSKPLYPKILTMLSFQDITTDTESLATLLGCSSAEVQKGLEKLLELQLVQQDQETLHWHSTHKQVKVPDAIGSGALLEYHAQSLHEAIEARHLPLEQRRYKAMLLPLDKVEFAKFLEELQVFVTEAMRKYDADDLRTRRLHQINFNIYTVSEEPEACLPLNR